MAMPDAPWTERGGGTRLGPRAHPGCLWGSAFPEEFICSPPNPPRRPARELSCHPSPETPVTPSPPVGAPLCGRRAQQRGQDTGKMLRVIGGPLTGTSSLLTSAHRRQISIALRASHTVALDLGKAEIITGNLPLAPGYKNPRSDRTNVDLQACKHSLAILGVLLLQ